MVRTFIIHLIQIFFRVAPGSERGVKTIYTMKASSDWAVFKELLERRRRNLAGRSYGLGSKLDEPISFLDFQRTSDE